MNRPALALGLVATLLIGAAAGFLGSVVMAHWVFSQHGAAPPRILALFGMPPGGSGNHAPGSRFDRLAKSLELTPVQVEHLRPRVEATRREFDALRDSMRARIDAELTPEQRRRWHEMQLAHPRPDGSRGSWPRPKPAVPGAQGDSSR